MNKPLTRSKEPIFWSLFGAGGTWAAIFMPVIVFIVGILLPLGVKHDGSMSLYIWLNSGWVFRVFAALVIILPLWCAFHRVHHTLHDVKVHFRGLPVMLYSIALILTVVTIALLIG